jgi:hypothetical protein
MGLSSVMSVCTGVFWELVDIHGSGLVRGGDGKMCVPLLEGPKGESLGRVLWKSGDFS